MRVRKKSFWLVGLLTPIALVAVGVLIAFLAAVNESETTTVGLYDLSGGWLPGSRATTISVSWLWT